MRSITRLFRGRSAGRHLRARFIAGLLIVVPVVITYGVLRLVFNTTDELLQPLFETVFGRRIPGLGLAFLLTLVMLIGALAASYVGQRLLELVQMLLLRVPVYNVVYSASKDLVESFSGRDGTGFKRVIAFEYPRVGTWTVGFLTNVIDAGGGEPMGVVYIPTTPTPTSGFVVLTPLAQVYDVDMSVRDAMRFVLSGGIVAPPTLKRTPVRLEGLQGPG